MFNPMPEFDFDEGGGWQEPDYVLSYLVSSLVNLASAPLGITLLVKGTVITGTLVGEREYLATLTEMLQSQVRRSLVGLSEEDRKIAEAAFDLTDLTEDYYPDMDDDDDELDEEEVMANLHAINFIHLKDPVVVSPQPAIGFSEGILPVMRIRITTIDGWMLGTSIPGFGDIRGGDSGVRH